MDQDRLLQGNPLLERSVRHRFPYLDPLNHVQVELLRAHRAQNPDEQVLRGIQLTINGISAGLRNTGSGGRVANKKGGGPPTLRYSPLAIRSTAFIAPCTLV